MTEGCNRQEDLCGWCGEPLDCFGMCDCAGAKQERGEDQPNTITASTTPVDRTGLEQAAWDWLDQTVSAVSDEHPSDIAYSADQMVDAFVAGFELRTPVEAGLDRNAVLEEAAKIADEIGSDWEGASPNSSGAKAAREIAHSIRALRTEGGKQSSHAMEGEVSRIARAVLQDKVWREARERFLNDATGTDFDTHARIVAAEHGARAALSATQSSHTEEPVAWMYNIGGTLNAYAYQLPDWSPAKRTETPLYAAPQPDDRSLAELAEVGTVWPEGAQPDDRAALIEALERLETANDVLCVARSQSVYDLMVRETGDELASLGEARRNARKALAAAKSATDAKGGKA